MFYGGAFWISCIVFTVDIFITGGSFGGTVLCGSGPAGEVVTNTQVLYCDGNNRDVTDGAGISGIATDWGGVGRGDEPGSDRQYHLDHRLPLLEEDEGA